MRYKQSIILQRKLHSFNHLVLHNIMLKVTFWNLRFLSELIITLRKYNSPQLTGIRSEFLPTIFLSLFFRNDDRSRPMALSVPTSFWCPTCYRDKLVTTTDLLMQCVRLNVLEFHTVSFKELQEENLQRETSTTREGGRNRGVTTLSKYTFNSSVINTR